LQRVVPNWSYYFSLPSTYCAAQQRRCRVSGGRDRWAGLGGSCHPHQSASELPKRADRRCAEDGHELDAHLRFQPGGEDSALVAVTGRSDVDDRCRSRLQGFVVHLVKPVDPDRLAGRLAGLAQAAA